MLFTENTKVSYYEQMKWSAMDIGSDLLSNRSWGLVS